MDERHLRFDSVSGRSCQRALWAAAALVVKDTKIDSCLPFIDKG